MKKYFFPVFLIATCAIAPLHAGQTLEQALPLLQQKQRTPAQTQQVLQLFRTAKDPNTVFAAGASLVRISPARAQEPVLMNIVLRAQDPLRQTFAAVIITAMGATYEEFAPLFEQALTGKDPVLRAYVAAAYAVIRPKDTSYAQEVVRLYILDTAFAQRAMNLLATESKQELKFLKQAASQADPQLRAAAATWLGNLHNEEANKQLFKMAKSETDANVTTPIATALAKNKDFTLTETAQGLRKNYNSVPASTYALALGFMTGNAVDTLRRGLTDPNKNVRINSARAAAYMAGVLSTPDAFIYSSDRQFDIHLLKSLIAPLSALATGGSEEEKTFAQNALHQLESLME